MEALKTYKEYDFPGKDPELAQAVVQRELKKQIIQNEAIYHRLKKLILLRERDRTTRENAIKVFKKLVKMDKDACQILL